MKIVTSSFNECCPLEKVKINYKNRHDWVTKELKADIKKREEMFKLSKKDPTDHNIQAHKKFRNIVLSRQRQAERKHFKEQYDQSLNEQNYKKAWDITRFLIDSKSNFSKNKITEYIVNNKKMTDPVAIANSFNPGTPYGTYMSHDFFLHLLHEYNKKKNFKLSPILL